MKIHGDISFIKPYSKPSRKKIESDSFDIEQTEHTYSSETKAASAAVEITGIQSVLSFSSKPSVIEQKTLAYGENLIHQLELIQKQLLVGTIETDDLSKMKESLNSFQDQDISSPNLRELINDIRVRLAVELQKHHSL
jgi:hypothetical protein